MRESLTVGSMAAVLLFALQAPAQIQINCIGDTGGSGPGTSNPACPTLNINGEVFIPPMPAPKSGHQSPVNTFYGYADPSMRKDPNGNGFIYLAYSYAVPATEPNTMYGLHVIDLNLAHSEDGGQTWSKDGVLFQTTAFNTTPANPPLATWNITSHETVNLYPFNHNGTTLWVQAHQEYLVDATGKNGLEGEQSITNFVSMTAVEGVNPADLLTLGNGQSTTGQTGVPEARLGNNYTNPALNVTQNLSALPSDLYGAAANCNSWTQQTLFQQADKLYLAMQCTQSTKGTIDQNDWGFFVFSTQPYSGLPGITATDASSWPWAFEGVIATEANAVALWKNERNTVRLYDPAATGYGLFTEMEFTMSSDGVTPLVILSPAQFSRTGGQSQPVVQFGCRAVKVNFSPLGLDLSGANGAPNVLASVTEQDLYTGQNEGPGACTYDPQSATGLVLVHKVEGSPHWTTLFETLIRP